MKNFTGIFADVRTRWVTGRHIYRLADTHTDWQPYRQTDKMRKTERKKEPKEWTSIQIKQTLSHTHMHTHIHTNTHTGFPTDAEVEVFTHKNRKTTYKIKIYASMWRTVLCTYFLVLPDRSAVSTSSRRKGKRSSTGIKVFCVVSLDMSMCIAIA